MIPPILASEFHVGERLTIVTHSGGEYPVEVVGHNSLPYDLIIMWLGMRPLASLNARDGLSTVSITELSGVRRGI